MNSGASATRIATITPETVGRRKPACTFTEHDPTCSDSGADLLGSTDINRALGVIPYFYQL